MIFLAAYFLSGLRSPRVTAARLPAPLLSDRFRPLHPNSPFAQSPKKILTLLLPKLPNRAERERQPKAARMDGAEAPVKLPFCAARSGYRINRINSHIPNLQPLTETAQPNVLCRPIPRRLQQPPSPPHFGTRPFLLPDLLGTPSRRGKKPHRPHPVGAPTLLRFPPPLGTSTLPLSANLPLRPLFLCLSGRFVDQPLRSPLPAPRPARTRRDPKLLPFPPIVKHAG